jgi:hypothetical protein
MDRLTSHLNYKTGNVYHPSLAAAMKLACKKMDRYYSLTDSSNVYHIAMVLHPGMKLEYFRNQKWEEEWIEEAENLVREEYISTYERTTDDANAMPAEDSDANNNSGFASFGDLSVTTVPHESEIQAYLTLPVENVKDPLKWWRANKHIYLNLHRMAQDYISIPGKSSHYIFCLKITIGRIATSTSVKRVFSQGRHLLPFARNGLSPSSIRAFLCFGSWSRCGLVLFSDVLEAVSLKSK